MVRRSIIGTLVFLIGVAIAVLIGPVLTTFIQDLYLSLSGHSIYFIGKNFNLFASPVYYCSFGVLALALWNVTAKEGIKGSSAAWILTIAVFFIALITICFIDIQLKLAQCTACADGRRGLRYNDISYSLIAILSILTALLPSLKKLLVRKRMPAPNKV